MYAYIYIYFSIPPVLIGMEVMKGHLRFVKQLLPYLQIRTRIS